MSAQKLPIDLEKDIDFLKSELFEVRQLLNFAFKEDIFDTTLTNSLSPNPSKTILYQNRQSKLKRFTK